MAIRSRGYYWLIVACSLPFCSSAHAVSPPALDPSDPHRFVWNGVPWYPIGYYPSLDAVTINEYNQNLTSNYHTFIDDMSANGMSIFRQCFAMGQPFMNLWTPYQRTGPGLANDGFAKFDVTKWNQPYFDWWRQVIQYAATKNVVMQVCILDSWHNNKFVRSPDTGWGQKWDFYLGANNINGLNVTTDASWQDPANPVYACHQAEIRKVIDNIGDLTNVIYEVCNESENAAWELQLADYLTSYETSKGFPRHLVMPRDLPNHIHAGGNDNVIPADHSNFVANFSWNQPLIADDDGGTPGLEVYQKREKLWACLTAGGHMSNFGWQMTDINVWHDPDHIEARRQMGLVMKFLSNLNVNLRGMSPSDGLVSRGYCYARTGQEYVVFVDPNLHGAGTTTTVSGLPAAYSADWFNTVTGAQHPAVGGPTFVLPSDTDWGLHIGSPRRVFVDLGTVDQSKGLTNVQFSDGHTVAANLGGRDCKRNVNVGSDLQIYFAVADNFTYQASKQDLYITFTYYDAGIGSLTLQYDSNTGSTTAAKYKAAGSVAFANTNTWKTATFHVTDAYFGNRENGGADFRVVGATGITIALDAVEVTDGHPVAVIAASSTSGALPLTAHLDASSSYDRGGTINTVQWDLDGNGVVDATGPVVNALYSTAGTYRVILTVTDSNGMIDTATIPIYAGTRTFSGTTVIIPGVIQAENADLGGEEVSYHETTTGNSGGVYRTDDVDVGVSTDTGGGYYLGWLDTGEWYRYSLNVNTAGSYDLYVRLATAYAGGVFHLEMDGLDITGPQSVPNTGGVQNWSTFTLSQIPLHAGPQILRLVVDAGGWNINYMDFRLHNAIKGDLDGDGDVDQSDFAILQRCLSGLEIPYSPGCAAADLDSSNDIDVPDVTAFLICKGGADLPPGC